MNTSILQRSLNHEFFLQSLIMICYPVRQRVISLIHGFLYVDNVVYLFKIKRQPIYGEGNEHDKDKTIFLNWILSECV